MNYEMVKGLLRHVLTMVGGILVAAGYMDEEMVEVGVGGLLSLIGVIWSIVSKRRSEEDPEPTY